MFLSKNNITVYCSQSLHWNGWQEEEENDVPDYKKCRLGFLFLQKHILCLLTLNTQQTWYCYAIYYFSFIPWKILTGMSY